MTQPVSGRIAALAVLAALLGTPHAFAQDPIDEVVVVGERLAPSAGTIAYSATYLDGLALETAPGRRLDDVLRTVPGFGLFRRSSSRVAHPTTQGVSLRNLGPNGAGRTLVTLDGVPQNDPFGGWVYWTQIPSSGISEAEIIRGGGAGPSGNSALAGVVRLYSRSEDGDFFAIDASLGSRNTQAISGRGQLSTGNTDLFVNFLETTTDGYHTLREDLRGPIDVPLDVDAWSVEAGVRHRSGDLTVTAKAGFFEEDRTNGTPLNRNATDAFDASLSLFRSGEVEWEAHVYYKDRDFANTFTALNDLRQADRVVLDQFDVPAESVGGSFRARTPLSETFTLEGGADFRFVEGSTNELFRFIDGEPTRIREAGGKQILGGAYAEGTLFASTDVTINASIRLDYWRNYKGRSIESEISDGTFLRDDRFDSRSQWVGNYRLGVAWDATDQITLRAATYSGFRVPTINELYRPFRVRIDVTGANEDLVPERLYGAEAGIRFAPTETFEAGITWYFANVKNTIANVTIGAGPGNFPPFGFVPAGGNLRQRRNLDRVDSDGLELDVRFTPVPELTLSGSWLYSESTVGESVDQPALEGNRLAQTPKHQYTLGLLWMPGERWRLSGQVRGASSQFEDDANALLLDDYLVVDLFGAWRLNDTIELYASAENLFDSEIEAGRTSTGLVTIGAPALFTFGVRVAR